MISLNILLVFTTMIFITDGINDGMFDMSVGGLFGQVFPLPNIFALQTQGAFLQILLLHIHLMIKTLSTKSIFAEGTIMLMIN